MVDATAPLPPVAVANAAQAKPAAPLIPAKIIADLESEIQKSGRVSEATKANLGSAIYSLLNPKEIKELTKLANDAPYKLSSAIFGNDSVRSVVTNALSELKDTLPEKYRDRIFHTVNSDIIAAYKNIEISVE